jgi:hypothetical protein
MALKLEEIRKEVLADGNQNYPDPVDRLQSNSEKALKYAEYLYRATRERNKQKILVAEKYSQLYRESKYNTSYLLKTKQDVESFVNTDVEYMKLKEKLNELDNIVTFITSIVDVYKQREASERLIFKAKTGIS